MKKNTLLSSQVTIVIKYFFQFGFFPFNQNKIDKNRPYHPPNIIGVEKKDGYVHYDLVQLLALFFHRSILKVPPRRLTLHYSHLLADISRRPARRRSPDRNVARVFLSFCLPSLSLFPGSSATVCGTRTTQREKGNPRLRASQRTRVKGGSSRATGRQSPPPR